MTTIAQYSQYSLISMAAYGTNLGTRPDLVQGYKDAGFTQAQADQFISDGWEVVSQSNDALYDDSGFSATLFHNTITGEYVFANRGTAGFQDLFTDAWGIATLGVAGAQIIDMYRYYKQLITPAGQAVTYTADEIDKLHGLGAFYSPLDFATTGMVQSYVQNDVGIGGLSVGQDITVTGHSLGGHLSVWLNALIPGSIDHVYTFNGAGLGGLFHSAAMTVAGLFGGISSIEDDASVTNIYAQGGSTIIAGVGGNVGQNVPVVIEAKSTLDSIFDGLYNHSIVTLADAAGVSALLSKLDPGMSLSTSNALFKSASSGNATMLESIVDALGRELLGVPAGNVTPTDNREVFYNNLTALTDSVAFQSLAGKLHLSPASSVVATEAKNEFSALIALQTLSTIALRGSNAANQALLDTTLGGVHAGTYALWQADQGLSAEDRAAGKANFSDSWLTDRAAMLNLLVKRNTTDETGSLNINLSGNVASTYIDLASGTTIETGSGTDKSRVVFGSDANDGYWGGAAGDRIYGGAGSDQLYGQGGNDYIEGGSGNDGLTAGMGSDRLLGGEGFDVYFFSAGDGVDRIIDSDADGKIVIDGIDLSAANAKTIIDPQYGNRLSWAWTEGGQQFHATLMDGDLTNGGTLWIAKGTRFAADRVVVENYKSGDLGLALSPATKTSLLPDTHINPFTTEVDGVVAIINKTAVNDEVFVCVA